MRSVTLDGERDRVTIGDDATFDRDDNEFAEGLVSYFPMEGADDESAVTGENGAVTVETDPEPADVDVERIEDAVRGRDVWRTRLSFRADDRISVALTVRPS